MQHGLACSFPKQVQRPKDGKAKTPGPGEYRLKPDLDPQFNSSRRTSPRISFPIAPKDQSEKVSVFSFIQVFSQVVIPVFVQVFAPVSDPGFIQVLTHSFNQHVLHNKSPRQGNTVHRQGNTLPRQQITAPRQGDIASCSAPATN